MSEVMTRLLGWLTETPVHAGTGQTTGAIDLPIQREGHTGHPTIAASGLKGALRQAAEDDSNQEIRDCVTAWFGPSTGETAGGDGHAGCVAFSDARVAAFPVRSLWDVFVWVTCPWVLLRMQRDIQRAGGSLALPQLGVEPGQAVAPKGAGVPNNLVVEDLTLKVTESDLTDIGSALTHLQPSGSPFGAVAARMTQRLLVLSNADYTYLVETACPVTARNVLTDEKTSKNLWYEESLPPDTLLYNLLVIEKPRRADEKCPCKSAGGVLSRLQQWVERRQFFQVGGNETVGEGWCRVVLAPVAGGKP